MNKEGKKCVIYIRVSTEMQIDGFSLDAQRSVLKRYAEREGMIVKKYMKTQENPARTLKADLPLDKC